MIPRLGGGNATANPAQERRGAPVDPVLLGIVDKTGGQGDGSGERGKNEGENETSKQNQPIDEREAHGWFLAWNGGKAPPP